MREVVVGSMNFTIIPMFDEDKYTFDPDVFMR